MAALQPRERNELGLHIFFYENKSLFSQLGHANGGSESIDEETLQETIRRPQDAATTLQLLVDHASEAATRGGSEDLLLTAHNLTSLLRCSNKTCENLSLCQLNSLYLGFSCGTRKAEFRPGRPQVEVIKEQIELLRSLHFSWNNIAKLLRDSLSKIIRKREFWQMEDETLQWSQISEEKMEDIEKSEH